MLSASLCGLRRASNQCFPQALQDEVSNPPRRTRQPDVAAHGDLSSGGEGD
jgi:hypothetical protein